MIPTDPAKRQEMVDRAYALGYGYEQKYGCCSQCVLAAIQDVFALGDAEVLDAIIKASHPLAGGGAITTRGTCGALNGGMMAISYRYGRARQDFDKGLGMEGFEVTKRLFDRFVAEFGSPICADVQTKLFGRSYDFWNPNEYAAFEAAGGHRDKCPSVVGRAARWTAEVLLDEEARRRAAG